MSSDSLRNRLRHSLVVLIALGGLVSMGAPSRLRGEQAGFSDARHQMVDQLVADLELENQRVMEVLKQVPRHEFVPLAQRRHAYEDRSLAIGYGQTISAPWAVAYMTEQLDPQPTDRVLEIGTGSGYQAAVLSQLVAEVYTIEIVEPLAERAERTLRRLGYDNVHVKPGDGYLGWPEHAPFDKIIVTCSPEKVPQPLIDQLTEGGRMLIPVGERYQQRLYLMEKKGEKLLERELIELVFVPMTGQAERLRQNQPDPTRPELFNGDFEQDEDGDGQPDGWHYRRQAKLASDSAPEGDHYVAFQNADPGREAVALQAFAVDGRQVRELEVTLWVRVNSVEPGLEDWQQPFLVVTFYDERRQPRDHRTIGPWLGTADWREVSDRILVPTIAREAILRIGLHGATGHVSFDDIRLRAILRHPLSGPQRR